MHILSSQTIDCVVVHQFLFLLESLISIFVADFTLQLAAEKNIKFYETSAQSNINIDEVKA